MALRRLTKEATSAYYLWRGGLGVGVGVVSPRIAALGRTFSAAAGAPPVATNPGGEFRVFGLFRSPVARRGDAVGISSVVGRNGMEGVLSRCSDPAFRAGVPNFGGLLAGRMARGFYPQLSEQPSRDIVGPSAKRHITNLWTLATKYRLPVGVIALIALGWQNPLDSPWRGVSILHYGNRRLCLQGKLMLKITSSFPLEQLKQQTEKYCMSLEFWAAGESIVQHMGSERGWLSISYSEERVNQLVCKSQNILIYFKLIVYS